MSDLAPIVLFVYNRPEHTRRTLASLVANRLAKHSDLIVYADGAKRPDHEAAVKLVRDIVRRIDGFKSLKVIERGTNFGLARSIISGVSEVCAAHGRVIVVEDDLELASEFLSFLNEGLARYQDEPKALQISGYAYPAHNSDTAAAFFLPMISCWGWATWSRAWAKFDPVMSALKQLDIDPAARRRFNIDDTYDYYGMACRQRKGEIDSWGIRWQLSLFAADGLALYPRDSLVYNTGVDASGTHGRGHAGFQRELGGVAAGRPDMSWPAAVIVDEQAMAQVRRLLYVNRPGVLRRIIGRLRA
jgi:hypothetical protein